MENNVLSVNKQKWRSQSVRMIIACRISFMLFNFLTTVSLNIFIPAVAELKGITTDSLYNANTIGNLISVVIALFIGALAKKSSLKLLTTIGLFIGGISYILIPLVPAGATGIFIATNYIATMFYAQLTVGARVGNWYPKRKGEILGIVTSVLIISSLCILPLFSKVTNKFGIKAAMVGVGIIVLVIAVIGFFVIKDDPRDVGLYPENSPEVYEERNSEDKNSSAGTLTYIRLLKQPRFLLFSLGWGLSMPGMMGLSIAVVSIMQSKGLSAEAAVSVAAFAGVFQLLGSIASGFLDTRVNLRMTISLFLGLEILGLALFAFVPEGMIILMVVGYYIVMFMMGAPNNLQPSSYLSMVNNEKDYMLCYSLATAIAGAIRATASSIIAFSTSNFEGSYQFAIIVFLVMCILSVILINVFGFKKLKSE